MSHIMTTGLTRLNRTSFGALFFLLGLSLCLSAAQASLTIEITQGTTGALPVAVVPFAASGNITVDMAAIIDSDLHRSGHFAPMARRDMPSQPSQKSQIVYPEWRTRGMPHLAVGKVRDIGSGRYEVQFQLIDVYNETQLAGYQLRGTDLRDLSHQVADIIYEKLTGEPGAFNTRIAYITVEHKGPRKATYMLQVADIDGFNPITITRSSQPLMSPSWSPDGRRIAYVSFENRRAEVYVQDITSGHRERVSGHPGLNNAPAWSPDGKRLALTLSKDGNPEIYVLELETRALQRITNNSAIDTEAYWAPDGQSLVFTSDRGGGPQIYQYYFTSQRVKRLTFEGRYNARPSISPDGRKLVFVHLEKGGYRIAVQDLANGSMQVLSGSRQDESPSFAPNSGMIMYATGENNRGVLMAVSVDGRVRQRLAQLRTEVREPAWSPVYR